MIQVISPAKILEPCPNCSIAIKASLFIFFHLLFNFFHSTFILRLQASYSYPRRKARLQEGQEESMVLIYIIIYKTPLSSIHPTLVSCPPSLPIRPIPPILPVIKDRKYRRAESEAGRNRRDRREVRVGSSEAGQDGRKKGFHFPVPSSQR